MPRGDLQIVQPAHVAEALIRAYAEGFHAEDRLSWQAIVQNKPVRPADTWDAAAFADSAYARELLRATHMEHVLVLPLAAPVLSGYPGVVHLLRSADAGDFTDGEIAALQEAIAEFDQHQAEARAGRKGSWLPRPVPQEQPILLSIIGPDLKPVFPDPQAGVIGDDRLRNQVVELARRHKHSLNGDNVYGDRVHIGDSHGDHWPFRVVTHKRYPALGDGEFTFVCLLPDCNDWGTLKPADFQADPELSRLIPAIKFMQQEFRRGPTLGEISATVKLSPFHFHRRFTELLGMTPKQYMLACQIHEAKVDLLGGKKELVTIAKECGFAHQSHFTSRFKQATGLTPTRWRRMAQQRSRAATANA